MIHVDKPLEPKLKRDWNAVLKSAYHGKCRYCEQREEQMNIEHYRPGALYGWLASSWDNLVLSCAMCNSKKSDQFPILGARIARKTARFNVRQDYDLHEIPQILNPESETNPENHFSLTKVGKIVGKDSQGRETIKVCDLNRKYLIEKRKSIFDLLKASIGEHVLSNNTDKIKEIVVKFIETNRNSDTEFLAFRFYILNCELKNLY